jgi:hypothetical protein
MAFQRGQSGNPSGRPRGRPDKRAKLRALLEPHAEALVNRAVGLALEGDTTALRLCLDRLVPALKPQDQPVRLTLGDDLAGSGRLVLEALGAAKLTPDEAGKVLTGLGALARIVETEELEMRITALEEQHGQKS